MADGAKKALDISGAQLLDINMGCPAPKIVKGGDGSALMCQPKLAEEIIRAVVQAVDVPVTVKFRKGWDADSQNYLDFAKMAEAAGAAAITLHGRTRHRCMPAKRIGMPLHRSSAPCRFRSLPTAMWTARKRQWIFCRQPARMPS